MTPGPLARRIAARRGEAVPQPEPKLVVKSVPEPWRPLWLRNLSSRDETGRILS